MNSSHHTLRLILGDQLNPKHSWYKTVNLQIVYVLMEVRQETDYVLQHTQKILAIFAAMRDFAKQLKTDGHCVHYLALDNPENLQSVSENLNALVRKFECQRVEWQSPDEWRLDEMLRKWALGQSLETNQVDSEHFITARHELSEHYSGRQQWLMENFYRKMRRRMNLLMDSEGRPEGGKWNFDSDNRKPWPGIPNVPVDVRPVHDHTELLTLLNRSGVQSFGAAQASCIRWPLNRTEALICLDDFIQNALPYFGDFEDAMSTKSQRLFHSMLSFSLNTKMLNPLEVISCIEKAYYDGRAPLAAVEGFIRQIVGWREYVRGIYWAFMPEYVNNNRLNHSLPLPQWFWTGETRMNCMQHAITQSLETAYAHHIQRLMIIGNFSLLVGLEPKALHHWYLGIYIDAFEWVELPNTIGMSQRADGGLIASKPYVSSGAYINRMSDYCRSCFYDHKQKLGERACPFNSLYWDFFARHMNVMRQNNRLIMVYRQLEKMQGSQIESIRSQASYIKAHIENI